MIGRIPLRIRGGPNQGLRWSLASSGRGVAAGTFEQARVDSYLRLLRTGDVVWDIGAHKGYMTLAAARHVGTAGHVYAFEPAPENLQYLRQHVAWSGLDNINVLPVAVSDEDARATFGGRGSSITFRLGGGDTQVDVRTMDTLLRHGCAPPTFIKIDVEGSEAAVLRGGADTLRPDVLALVAIHSREQYAECRTVLEQRGFRVHESSAMRHMMQRLPDGWSPDPDLLAVGPARSLDAETLARFTGQSPD